MNIKLKMGNISHIDDKSYRSYEDLYKARSWCNIM